MSAREPRLRRRGLGFALALGLGFGLGAMPACNVVRLQERHLERRYARADTQAEALTAEGVHLAYRDGNAASERTPVLLIHGFGASVEALAQTRRGSTAIGARRRPR